MKSQAFHVFLVHRNANAFESPSPGALLRHSSRRDRGFTLLELLVSIVLMTTIVGILAASMRIGYHSVGSGEKKAEAMERYRVSLRLIDTQLQSGISLVIQEEDGKKSVFVGKKDLMTFVSNSSLFGERRGCVIASYRIVADANDKRTLFLEENTVGVQNKTKAKLLEGLDSIYFEYYQHDAMNGQKEGGIWLDEVNDETKLPQKVRVYLELGGKKVLWTIPVRIQESVSRPVLKEAT